MPVTLPAGEGPAKTAADTLAEEIRRAYRRRVPKYRMVSKYQFWTPPVVDLVASVSVFPICLWPSQGRQPDAENDAEPGRADAQAPLRCPVASSAVRAPAGSVGSPRDRESSFLGSAGLSPPRCPNSSSHRPAALLLPDLPQDVTFRSPHQCPDRVEELKLYGRALYKVWQLFLSALFGPPVPLTRATTFAVCGSALNFPYAATQESCGAEVSCQPTVPALDGDSQALADSCIPSLCRSPGDSRELLAHALLEAAKDGREGAQFQERLGERQEWEKWIVESR